MTVKDLNIRRYKTWISGGTRPGHASVLDLDLRLFVRVPTPPRTFSGHMQRNLNANLC
ncbi:hypothetical protein ElyMa_001769500, partial [Elysia marginata]